MKNNVVAFTPLPPGKKEIKVVEIYEVTGKFPRHELYGLVSQLRRAAISVP